eukprot:GHVL01024373.1.p2 GENE.GHVL01024373.1~~GHVL01024373.1.p2  ORF type:complete len:216 (-),score=30.08 GHVL01024373.1:1291-1938(-)
MKFGVISLCGLLASHISEAAKPIQSKQSTTRGTMTVSSFSVSAGADKAAMITFGDGPKQFKMGVEPSGEFTVLEGTDELLKIGGEGIVVMAPKLVTKNLEVHGDFSVNGVKQWRMVHAEELSVAQPPIGWDNNDYTQCAGVVMLGGYCKFAEGEDTKKFESLPPHDYLRVKATYHFIDSWIGEAGFMRMNIGSDGKLLVFGFHIALCRKHATCLD